MKRAAAWIPLVAIAFLAAIGMRIQFERWIAREAAHKALTEALEQAAERGIAAVPSDWRLTK